jgi:hypothetical protein
MKAFHVRGPTIHVVSKKFIINQLLLLLPFGYKLVQSKWFSILYGTWEKKTSENSNIISLCFLQDVRLKSDSLLMKNGEGLGIGDGEGGGD